MSRRLGILSDAPVSATESGKTVKVDNPYFSLLPEMEAQGVVEFLTIRTRSRDEISIQLGYENVDRGR